MTDRPASEFRNRVENDWADSYPQILEAGYMLRPRYSPAWIPSWTKSYWKRQKDCEDGQETCKVSFSTVWHCSCRPNTSAPGRQGLSPRRRQSH
jgi:hypothetical protein